MIQVMNGVGSLVMAASPILIVAGLLALAAWRDRTREALVARQIRLTDAIAAELGAVVAPVVTRGWGRWQVEMAVPVGRAATVAKVLTVTDRVLPRPYAVVLTPRELASDSGETSPVVAGRRLRAA